jgi:hypothetical protein
LDDDDDGLGVVDMVLEVVRDEGVLKVYCSGEDGDGDGDGGGLREQVCYAFLFGFEVRT